MAKTLEKMFLISALLFISACSLLVAYWLYYPVTVITFKNPEAIPVDKKFYYPGDRIIYTLDYCKYINITGVVSRAIEDDFRQTFADVLNSNLPVGCHTQNIGDLFIPAFFTQGTYHLTISGSYIINPLRRFQTPLLRTVDFQVIVPEVLGNTK